MPEFFLYSNRFSRSRADAAFNKDDESHISVSYVSHTLELSTTIDVVMMTTTTITTTTLTLNNHFYLFEHVRGKEEIIQEDATWEGF